MCVFPERKQERVRLESEACYFVVRGCIRTWLFWFDRTNNLSSPQTDVCSTMLAVSNCGQRRKCRRVIRGDSMNNAGMQPWDV